MRVLVFASILLAAGCAQSSGVLKQGPDTYTVSTQAAPARGGMPGAKRMAYEEASDHCGKLGREMKVISEATRRINQFGAGWADLTFRCLQASDPELTRPNLKAVPDVVIENRR